ncbi:MAG TPA: hypothetical protein VLA03_02690 [Draconibacterium sp.]|nr:hypothetical protein [Draconibacterium sp.]
MKILKLLLAVVVVALLFSECKYSFIVPEDIPVIDPDDPNAPQISFANDIAPIFNANNNCTACHKTGNQMPDLTTENAYKSLNSARYINDNSPEESLIYKHPHPDSGTHSQKKYTAAQAALVLGWIQQGAKNN